jgi:hypothetical protein
MIKDVSPAQSEPQIQMVQDWFEELNRLAPPAPR